MTHPYITSTEPAIKKLQLGCGGNFLAGWLNTDLEPLSPTVLYLDASMPFEFPDNSFDYIFSEHMIEHMPYAAGVNMLKESFRILKPGGRIRITCPDFQFLLGLYTNRERLNKEYSDWACTDDLKWPPFKHPLFTINNYMRAWGHQFIYDQEVLASTLSMLGFDEIESYAIQESDDPLLCNLEIPSRMRPGYLQLESMTLEAVKPA